MVSTDVTAKSEVVCKKTPKAQSMIILIQYNFVVFIEMVGNSTKPNSPTKSKNDALAQVTVFV